LNVQSEPECGSLRNFLTSRRSFTLEVGERKEIFAGKFSVYLNGVELVTFCSNGQRLTLHTFQFHNFSSTKLTERRSKWPRCLRHRSAAAHLLRLWVWIPPGAWMSTVIVVCCQIEVFAKS